MKKNYVDSLVTGSDFDDFFLMKSMAVRVGSNQKKYIDMILGDKTGDVSAKKWDASEAEIAELESYGENAVIKVRASVTEWQGKQQLKVSKFRQASETDDFDIEEFIRTAPEKGSDMYDYIMSEVAQIRDPQLKTVCTVLMERNREKLMYYPAASKNHHALMSGLLFHMKRMLAMGKKIDLKSRRLIQEASNLDSNRGAVRFIRSVLRTTLIFELAGAILSFLVFVQDYPPLRAMGISLFHSVAAFNNSGFDILGNYQNLIPYQNSVMLNLTTCGLIFFGGIGFLVIREMVQHKLRWKKYSMHAKVVLSVSGALILAGTLLLRATEDISWLGALFHSVSARTAGFSTYPLKAFSNAGLLVLTALM